MTGWQFILFALSTIGHITDVLLARFPCNEDEYINLLSNTQAYILTIESNEKLIRKITENFEIKIRFTEMISVLECNNEELVKLFNAIKKNPSLYNYVIDDSVCDPIKHLFLKGQREQEFLKSYQPALNITLAKLIQNFDSKKYDILLKVANTRAALIAGLRQRLEKLIIYFENARRTAVRHKLTKIGNEQVEESIYNVAKSVGSDENKLLFETLHQII